MNDPILENLERREKRFFAHVVFIAKTITWTALLALAAIVETALVIKAAQIEFASLTAQAEAKFTERKPPPVAKRPACEDLPDQVLYIGIWYKLTSASRAGPTEPGGH